MKRKQKLPTIGEVVVALVLQLVEPPFLVLVIMEI
jgi:hypothetical protein